jgi:hypothetical protein
MSNSQNEDPRATATALEERAPRTANPQVVNNDTLTLALALAGQGRLIMPYFKRTADDVCMCKLGNECFHHPDPHPATQLKNATVDANTIIDWSEKLSDSDLAVVIGRKSRMAILTVDNNEDATDNFERLQFQHGSLPKSMELRNDGGDTIIFFDLPDDLIDTDLQKNNIAAFTGVHLQTGYGTLCLSNLLCSTGVDDVEAWMAETPLAELPEWVVSLAENGSANKVDPFPCHIFPDPIADFILESAESLSCPIDLLAVPALAVLATAIGTSRLIEVKSGWQEQAVIFAGVVAEPGSKKSPALQLVTSPLFRRQREMKAKFKQQRTDHVQNTILYMAEEKRWYNEFRKAPAGEEQGLTPPPTRPQEPERQQVVTTDFTIEAIAGLNERSPRGILCVCDELTSWVSTMNQGRGGKGGDRNKWQSLWNSAPITVNRKGEPDPVELDNPFVSVVGCIPTDVLGTLTDERNRNDGFLHRLLLVMPERKSYGWSNSTVASATTESYERVVDELFKLQGVDDQYGGVTPVALRLTNDARRVFIDWHKRHTDNVQHRHFPDNLRGAWHKLKGYAARFALIIHLCRVAAGESDSEDVDCQSVKKAVALVDYFKSHIRCAYAALRADPGDKKFNLFLTFVRKRGGEVTAREVQRSKVAGFKNSQDVREMFQEAAQRGYGELVAGDRKSVFFKIY